MPRIKRLTGREIDNGISAEEVQGSALAYYNESMKVRNESMKSMRGMRYALRQLHHSAVRAERAIPPATDSCRHGEKAEGEGGILI